jgi:ABC-type antimicrobial peptide transport system permease subunit
MASQLFQLSPRDPLTLIVTVTGMAAIGAVAAYLPARRAMRVNPMIALKE